MSVRADERVHLRWEPERFYWSVLPAPGWKRAGVLPEGLRPELEDEVPLAPGELHAVCAPVGDGRVVVCAAARDLLADLAVDAAALSPSALPRCVEASIDPAMLNLLVGEFEPAFLRRRRVRRHALAAALVALGVGLLTFGFLRRVEHWNAIAERAAEARSGLVARTVGEDAGPYALLAEVARLRQQRDATGRVESPGDAALALAAVLRGWPADVPSRPQTLSVSPAGATISVSLDGDPAPFLRSIRAPEGWSVGEPRLNSVSGVTRVTLQLTRTEGSRK